MKRIICYLFGAMLKIVGLWKWKRFQHLYFLGHYLMGSGRTIRIEPGLLLRRDAGKLQIADLPEGRSIYYIPKTPSLEAVWKCIGKARIRRHKGTTLLLDYYMFYPLCPFTSEHGHACRCPENKRAWTSWDERLRFTIPLKKAPPFKWKARAFGIKLTILGQPQEREYCIGVDIEGKDSIWADKGKPFWTACRIPPAPETEKGEKRWRSGRK